MTEAAPELRADVLARLLLIQSTAGHLPDPGSLVEFVCRGLGQVPGVSRAWFAEPAAAAVAQPSSQRFPVQYGGTHHGEILVQLADPEAFRPYAPHVTNLVFMAAVMLEERRQRSLAESHQRELELRVEERTRELSAEVRDRRAAEAVALAEKRRAEDYLDIAEAIIVELDARARIVVLNKRGCDLLGVRIEEALGQDWFDLAIPAGERHGVRAVFERVLHGEADLPAHHDNAVVSRTGDRRMVAWHNVPRWEGGRLVGTLSSGLDITERLRLLEQLHRAQRLDAIGVLAGGIAHDFNNLLGGIFGFIDLAQGTAEPGGPLAEALQDSRTILQRAKGLTQQLLTFAKGGAPVRRVIELGPLLTQAVHFALSGSPVSCRLDLAPDLPRAEVDAAQIGQVVDNLVRNAAEAMPGGGTVVVSGAPVDVRAGEHAMLAAGLHACITVRDSGPGIAPEVLTRVFDPFFTTKERGTGLGLATAYSIVQRHQGCIEVESQPGRGATFRVFLPAASGAAAEAAAPPRPAHRGSGSALVLDDEAYLRDLLTRMLGRLGYEVTSVSTGQQAIEAARAAAAAGAPFKIAILDLTIAGGMGGREAVGELRRLAPDLVAIASSGYSSDPVIARPGDYGFSASLAKPFTGAELAGVLAHHAPPTRDPHAPSVA